MDTQTHTDRNTFGAPVNILGIATAIYNFNARVRTGDAYDWEADGIEREYRNLTDAQKARVDRCTREWEIEDGWVGVA